MQRVLGLTRNGPRRVSRQYVDLALAQFNEPFLCIERDELDLFRVVEDRCRNGATKVDVKSRPIALVVNVGKSWQPSVDAAEHRVPPDRPFEGLGIVAFVRDGGGADYGRDRTANQQPGERV